MARTAKKNDRCPFKDTCEQKCEWKNKEIECDYYRYNACPGKEIEDQEELREQYAAEHYKVGSESDEVYTMSPTPGVLEANDRNGIVYLPIDKLIPHKNNPRRDLGELDELADSIKAKGVLQNLTVVDNGDGTYTTIIGHRRCAAAKKAGMKELPCIIVDMTEREQAETMLLENIQRKDLTTADEIFGYQMMFDMGATIDEIAEETGFSKATIRKRRDYARLDAEKLKKACEKQISFAELDKLSKIEDAAVRDELLGKYGTSDYNWSYEKAVRHQNEQKQADEWRNFFITHKYNLTALTDEERRNTDKYEFIAALTGQPTEQKMDDWENMHNWVFSDPTYFYIDLDYSCVIRIYKDAVPQSEEEKAKEAAAEERQRLMDERREQIKEIAKTAFECRKRAIEECSVQIITDNREQIIRLMSEIALSDTYLRMDQLRFLDVCRIKYKKPKNNWDSVEYSDVSEDLTRKNTDKILLALAYAMIKDSNTQSYYNWSCAVWENDTLDLAYKLLDIIGYEMSDEEKRFVNGDYALEGSDPDDEDYGEYDEDDEEWGEDE